MDDNYTTIDWKTLEHGPRRIGMVSPEKRDLLLTIRDGYTTIQLGEFEIWDEADLELIRDTIKKLVAHRDCRCLGIDMKTVRFIPSGFFGMLFDIHEREGMQIRIFGAQENVREMLWFRKFFDALDDNVHELLSEPKRYIMPGSPHEWINDAGLSQEELHLAFASAG